MSNIYKIHKATVPYPSTDSLTITVPNLQGSTASIGQVCEDIERAIKSEQQEVIKGSLMVWNENWIRARHRAIGGDSLSNKDSSTLTAAHSEHNVSPTSS